MTMLPVALPFAVLAIILAPLQPPAPLTVPTRPAVTVPTAQPILAIEQKAWDILTESETAMYSLQSFAAECWTTVNYASSRKYPQGATLYEVATLTDCQPNLVRYDRWRFPRGAFPDSKTLPQRTADYIEACDGTTTYRQYPAQQGAYYDKNDSTRPAALRGNMEPWQGFFTTKSSHRTSFSEIEKRKWLTELRYAGTEDVEGTSCNVVAYRYQYSDGGERTEIEGKLFLAPDNLVRRQIEKWQFGNKPFLTRDALIRNIRTNFPMPDAKTFAYVPGPDVKPAPKEKATPLLANGTKAPLFTLQDIHGKPVRLSDFRGKVVLLDFWATWCDPCMQAFPHTNALTRKYRGRNLVTLAVNVWEEKSAFQAWVPQHKAYDAVLFLRDPNGNNGKDIAKALYQVSGIPTQYLIDQKGIIRASIAGFDESDDSMEKAIVAALR